MKPPHACVILLTALGGGCASTVNLPEKRIVVNEDQTELITPVGSHIKVRVLRGQKAPLLSSPTDSMSGERMNDSLLTRDGSFPGVPIH